MRVMKKKIGLVKALSQRAGKTGRGQPAVQNKPSTPRQSENTNAAARFDEDQWQRDMATLRRAAEDRARRQAAKGIELRPPVDQFDRLATSVLECSDDQRPRAFRLLYNHDPERAASFLNMVLHAGTREERQQIGASLEASGLVEDAIRNLTGSSHNHSYRAFSLLFLVAKAGTVGPLIRVVEDHPNIELRLALIRLLGTSGAPDLVPQFQRLLANNSMPAELCIAMNEAVVQIGGHAFAVAPSAA
jgi:hypothetical protein